MTAPTNRFSTLGGRDPRSGMAHKKNCAKCKYSKSWDGRMVLCDYYCKHWDETGVPQRRPYPAETCPLWKKPKKKGRPQKPPTWSIDNSTRKN